MTVTLLTNHSREGVTPLMTVATVLWALAAMFLVSPSSMPPSDDKAAYPATHIAAPLIPAALFGGTIWCLTLWTLP